MCHVDAYQDLDNYGNSLVERLASHLWYLVARLTDQQIGRENRTVINIYVCNQQQDAITR